MKLRRYSGTLLLTLLLSAGAIAAVVWSPISCSCDAAWVAIDGAAGLNSTSPAELNPQALANGFAKMYRGAKLEPSTLPHTLVGSNECGAVRVGRLRCTWWLEEAATRQRGYTADFYIGQGGIFRKVRVFRVQRVTANNSSKPTPLRGAA